MKFLKSALKHLKLKLTSQTETELIKHFEVGASVDLYFKFGTNAISNTEIKEFVHLKKGGWYQTIKNNGDYDEQSVLRNQK